MFFSIIIPLYNRPGEIDELLASLCEQTNRQFEVIIVEDGSTVSSETVVEKYRDKLTITYIEKDNSGPGPSRNTGAGKAIHDYLIFFDSDCIIPPNYITHVAVSHRKVYRCLWWSRCRFTNFHNGTEGHQLFHDIVLYDRWYPGR